ncbi:MAG: PTS sugar transporter subunit IIB [Oscillospiraceae bacterium]|nr:PTS sugar transporter subunit IIB [Oscillospiraceae bacterium]
MAKLDNKTFLVCCANGAGTSLMMKMTLEKVLKKLGVKPGRIHHCAISEGKSSASQFNIVFTTVNFAGMMKAAEEKGTVVLGLKNVMSAAEMEQALRNAGLAD